VGARRSIPSHPFEEVALRERNAPLRHLCRFVGIVGLGLFAFSFAVPSAAQDRAALSRLLREGQDFRVRVQAAFAIGNTHDPILRPQLERALRDEHVAVRAAAATALGRLGSPRAIPALERALRDPERAVRGQAERSIELLRSAQRSSRSRGRRGHSSALEPLGSVNWSHVRAAVLVGDMRNRSSFRDGELERRLRDEVEGQLRRLSRIVLFESAQELSEGARSQMRRRRVPMLRMDGALTKVRPERRDAGLAVRCEVSIMLLEEPGRNLRGELRGAATGMDRRIHNPRQQEARLAHEALSGAVRSAMSTADVAIARAAHP
jgi:hypothetical protein